MLKNFRRTVGLAIAATLLLTAFGPNAAPRFYVYAQDANTVTVDGSEIASPVLKGASQAYTSTHADAKITLNVSGTAGGFDKLCSGSLDIAMAVRAISDAEIAACKQNNVNFVELVLGYDALAVVINQSSKVACLTVDQLNKVLGPAATTIKNWKDVDAALGDQLISAVYAPPADSQTVTLAQSIIAGGKLRSDLQTVPPEAAGAVPSVAAKVSGDANSIGLLNLAQFNKTAGQGLNIKALQVNGSQGCSDPTVPNLEEARYPAGETLFLYVNVASLDRKVVPDFLAFMFTGDGKLSLSSNGFTEASGPSYDRDTHYVTLKQTGRTFSLIQNINVPANTAGTIEVDGSPDLFPVLKAVNDAFSPRYANIKLDNVGYGNEAGYSRLCANNVDIIGATRLPTDTETAACQKANVQTLSLKFAVNSVVVLVNANNTFAACLTADQLAKIFSLDSEGKVKKWSDVSPDFPATDLIVIAPGDGAPETDWLLNAALPKQVAPLRRKDTTDNDDALYRAAATQNVAGAITYMNFTDFQKVTSKVKAVQINTGKGCVDPSAANVTNGSYPLAKPLYVVLNLNSFSRPDIKAFVWYMINDEALAVLAKQGLVGTDTAGITAARDVALQRFAQTPAGPVGTAAATGQANFTANPATSAATASSVSTATSTSVPTTASTAVSTAAPTAAPTAASTSAR